MHGLYGYLFKEHVLLNKINRIHLASSDGGENMLLDILNNPLISIPINLRQKKECTWWQYRYPAPSRKLKSQKRNICISMDLNWGNCDADCSPMIAFCFFCSSPVIIYSHFFWASSLEFWSQSSIGLVRSIADGSLKSGQNTSYREIASCQIQRRNNQHINIIRK